MDSLLTPQKKSRPATARRQDARHHTARDAPQGEHEHVYRERERDDTSTKAPVRLKVEPAFNL
ncbi:MAG: hypothetical protein O3B64_01855 [bacterium]|nr:hypothetical protein [bacterium]